MELGTRRLPPESGLPAGARRLWVAREEESVQRWDDAAVHLAQIFMSEKRDRKLIYLQSCVNQPL